MKTLSLLAAGSCLLLAGASHAINVDFDSLGYLGGPGDDAAGGVGILPDHRVVYGGTATRSFDASASVDLFGGGSGVVATFDPTGHRLVSAARLGTAIRDLDVSGSRIGVAATGAGPTVLAADGRTVLWNDATVPNAERVSVGVDGNTAVLTAGKQLRLYDAAGGLVSTRGFGDSVLADVVVDDARGRVIVTGFNNKNTGREPIQVPFIRAFDQNNLTGGAAWTNYDWAGSVGRNEQDANVADSRGVRLELGGDGKLYFAARADGGNSTYLFDPQDVNRRLPSDEFVTYDAWSQAFNTKSEAKALFGRYDAGTGEIEKMQWLLTRLGSGAGNTLNAFGIAADADGTIYLTGQAAATIKDRDLQEINGEAVSGYDGGELFVAKISADFKSRDFWTVLTKSGKVDALGTGIDVLDGHLAFGGTQRNPGGSLFSVDAFQSDLAGGAEGYLGVFNAPTTVPEPTTAALLALATPVLLRRRCRGA